MDIYLIDMEAKEFEYTIPANHQEMEEIMSLGQQIAMLLDKCGLNTCVIHKSLWKEEGSDDIHESWSVAPCNSISEDEVKTYSREY